MSTFKLNWGARAAILYGGFVILMVSLVTASMKQDFQLVSKDYYEQEVKYQEVLDAGKNQSALSAPVSIAANSEMVTVKLPAEFNEEQIEGKVTFYAAANAAWDKSFSFPPGEGTLLIPRSQLHQTTYTVKVTWQGAGKTYYQENTLSLFQK
ncbi:MAG: hypothetical protein EOP49_14470 [Sphingobacteriales bacterium]|nr:MAG: hypothetical protein EOP49_14470 [Sphingobacteriales bacterium]